MAALVVLVLFFSFLVGGSDGTWCVCKSDASAAALQKTLDYACGAGADCNTILQNGACYSPNTVIAHCSYAVNSYFQRKGQAAGTCEFSGTASITNGDPSYSGCSYPSSASTAGTGTTTTTGTPTTTTAGGGTFSPTTNGIPSWLGPSGNTMSTDGSGASSLLDARSIAVSFYLAAAATLCWLGIR